MISPIIYHDFSVSILDQNRLPDEVVYLECHSAEEIADAIRKLKVRGAPLIGIAAAFGLALGINNYNGPETRLKDYFIKTKDLLAATRPTAVNLFWALKRMEKIYVINEKSGMVRLKAALIKAAGNMLAQDILINQTIGHWG